ncbi:MAG TPA: hypothetical protein VLC93_12090, partial [Myxococcota bacterium]|nr:hypothetical protein [Myxococcota bacterium]
MKDIARALALLVIAVIARPALAGNLDAVFVSDQAAMMGGAVTALASDTTAIFYNPAGLVADTSHASISLSTSSYGFSTRSSPSLLVESPSTRSSDLTTQQLLSVPAAIAFFVPLSPRLGAGFGIFVPVALNEWQRDAVVIENGTTVGRASFENRLVGTDFRIGGGVGYALTDTLRVGAALFATYTVAALHLDFATTQHTDEIAVASTQISVNDEVLQLGAVATLGIQWQPRADVIIAATWFLPELEVTSQDRLSQQASAFGPDGAVADNAFLRITSGVRSAGNSRLFFGAGYRGERLRLGLEGNFTKPSGDFVKGEVWNARAGMQARVVEGVWLGAGLFTDRSPDRFDSTSLLSRSVDFYGATFGVRLESSYLARLVRDWKGKSDANESSLVFFTALTARYAYGTGRTAVVAIADDGTLEGRGVDVTVHEISGQLST